ncbi:MAG: hypothetical protein ACPLYD_05725 [Anaerolineae bacterium]|jgi:hypothetical protein
MMTWLEMVAHYKGYQNLLQERGELRFPRQIKTPRESLRCKALRGLGYLLVLWGQQLQERYPAPASPPSWRAYRTG